MKYKTEVEFCEDTMPIILGLLAGEKRRIICVPEAPFSYFSNEQIDMLLLDVKNKEYLCIEFKLKSLGELQDQVERNNDKKIPCIGIINTNTKKGNCRIFGYTGTDNQIERLGSSKFGILYKFWWRSIFTGLGMIYYWAYKNNKNDFRGGITGGGRKGFSSVYMQAIKNLHAEYGQLDFMLTHSALKSNYSIATSKKYYRQALLKDDK